MPRDMGMATQTLMGADPDIQTVLVSRLSQMSPEELKTLDQAIIPQVRGALMKLYWKVKINGKWTFRAAIVVERPNGYLVIPNDDGTWYNGDDIIEGQMP